MTTKIDNNANSLKSVTVFTLNRIVPLQALASSAEAVVSVRLFCVSNEISCCNQSISVFACSKDKHKLQDLATSSVYLVSSSY